MYHHRVNSASRKYQPLVIFSKVLHYGVKSPVYSGALQAHHHHVNSTLKVAASGSIEQGVTGVIKHLYFTKLIDC